MTDDTDTTDYVPENSDASQPPDALEERDDDVEQGADAEWYCASCGAPVVNAHDLATHECDGETPDTEE